MTQRIREMELVRVAGPIKKPIEPGRLYYSERFKLALHLCACGCGDETATPISNKSDEWQLGADEEQKLTLHGSIQQRGGCGSHYSIIAGRVVWH